MFFSTPPNTQTDLCLFDPPALRGIGMYLLLSKQAAFPHPSIHPDLTCLLTNSCQAQQQAELGGVGGTGDHAGTLDCY